MRLVILPDTFLDASSSIGRARYDIRGVSELLAYLDKKDRSTASPMTDTKMNPNAEPFSPGPVKLQLDTLVDCISAKQGEKERIRQEVEALARKQAEDQARLTLEAAKLAEKQAEVQAKQEEEERIRKDAEELAWKQAEDQ